MFDDTDHLFGSGNRRRMIRAGFPISTSRNCGSKIESYDGVVLLGADDRAHLDPKLARQCDEVVELADD